jgi:hypothetical protein
MGVGNRERQLLSAIMQSKFIFTIKRFTYRLEMTKRIMYNEKAKCKDNLEKESK